MWPDLKSETLTFSCIIKSCYCRKNCRIISVSAAVDHGYIKRTGYHVSRLRPAHSHVNCSLGKNSFSLPQAFVDPWSLFLQYIR